MLSARVWVFSLNNVKHSTLKKAQLVSGLGKVHFLNKYILLSMSEENMSSCI